MESMSNYEIGVYLILVITNCIITWQWALKGFWQVGIEIPRNIKVFASIFVGMATLLIASYAEKKGYISLSLMKEENFAISVAVILGIPFSIFFFARYIILPKGLPEYNRARILSIYWTGKYYRPGIVLNRGQELADFARAKKAVDFFKKSIELQMKGSRSGSITRTIPIDQDQVDYDGRMRLPCPNCGFQSRAPIAYSAQGSGICTMCGCGFGYKVIKDQIFLTAFGKIQRRTTPQNLHNIAVAYEELAFLLRMMNKFDEAKEALKEADKMINQVPSDLGGDNRCQKTQSLILFRKGEIAHTLGDKEEAKRLYKKSLAVDMEIGDQTDRSFIEKMIGEVS